VRPKRARDEEYDESEEEEGFEGSEVEGESDEEGLSGKGSEAGGGGDDETGSLEEEQVRSEDGDAQQQISNVSFGALKQAQDALSRKRKRSSDVTEEQDDKLEALRKRLRQIKEEKAGNGPKASSNGRNGATSKPRVVEDGTASDEDDDDDSDSPPSEEGAPSYSRASKHAPMAQSTRHQVTRKRTVVDVPKRIIRDPRFDALQQHSAHPGSNSEKAYSFLRDYQKSEISELKSALKRTKNEDDKTTLRRKVNSMENRLKAKDAKEREQEVVRKHRREERERVEQGKTPFYLKKKEVKERALVEKFKGMKGKERQKLVEKRKKKEGQKEKKRMPVMRRGAG